jgi:1,4-dihydroxy-6-naphthoate synthase
VRPLSLGFSPCPNDTFIFYALMHGHVEAPELRFAPETLADVESLNEWALEGRLDVTKLSFHALGHVLDEYVLLNSGGALGRGCGPLLVAGRRMELSELAGGTVAIPGRLTTAAMLLRLFAPACPKPEVMRFDRIMPAIAAGDIDAGVIIHESRFTYRQHGLVLLQDLGAWWEELSGLPIPLGGIAARRSLGEPVLQAIERAIRASIRWAFAHRLKCLPYIRSHARELEPDVINDHIALYVNDFSIDYGAGGRQAIAEFLRRGRQAAILPAGEPLFQDEPWNRNDG